MLSLLNENGPDVEGIFRKSANAASCQTLKEKLDLGKDVNLREESILVVASVLKVEDVPASFTVVISLKLCVNHLITITRE